MTEEEKQKQNKDIVALEKRIKVLEEALNINTLAFRVLDVAIQSRGEKTAYVSGGNTVACDVVLDIQWQGRRYKLPAFEL